MSQALHPARALRLLGTALIAGAAALLVIAAFVARSIPERAGLEPLAYAAGAFALLSPAVAAAVRGGGLVAAELPADAEAARPLLGRHIASLAVLEAAVVLCAVALITSPFDWPLLLALLPLAAMVLGLPRAAGA